MKQIKLIKLSLQNWRGQTKEIDFSDNMIIKGRNESGKSTVLNALLWVLTSADEYDRVNYKLFDEKLEQTYENAQTAIAELTLSIDGVNYVLKKSASQGWTRRKGNDEYERKGTDDYKFEIDSIERSATDYRKFIEEAILPIDILKICLNTRHFLFNTKDWKEQRKLLEKMVGEIKFEDFKGNYKDIEDDLKKYGIDDCISKYKSQIKTIKEKADSLPTTIEVLKQNLPDISDLSEVQEKISEIKGQIENIDKQLSGSAESIKPIIEKRNRQLEDIEALKKEYSEKKSEYEMKPIEEANKIKMAMSGIDLYNEQTEKKNAQKEKEIEDAKKQIEELQTRIEALNAIRQKLLYKNKACKAKIFTAENELTCSYCGQRLPNDKIEELRKQFYEKKEEEHQEIVEAGKANKRKIDEIDSKIKQLNVLIAEGYESIPLKDKSELTAKLAQMRADFVPFNETIEAKEIVAKIANINANLVSIPQQDNDALTNTKKMLMDEYAELNKKLAKKDDRQKAEEKIASLQKELKENISQKVLIEGKLEQIKKYEREKADIIRGKVNANFDYVSVIMTEKNKSGDDVDTCQILDKNGVNALVTNGASKVRCGIDIARAFAKFFDVNMPIVIDDCESINDENLPQLDTQTIRMYVADCPFTIINE